MPTLIIRTNVHKSDVASDFLHKASQMFQEAIRKPIEYCQVIIFPDLLLSHGNTTDPAAHIEVMSIGNLGPTANQRISSSVSEFIQKELGIDPKKAYIYFTNKQAFEVGYNGTTFDTIIGAK